MTQLLLSLLLAASPPPTGATETVTFGAFGRVTVYAPTGPLFVSGDGGWTLGVVPMAQRLRAEGALVAGIDIRAFLRGLERARGPCAYPAGDLEELSRAIQLRHRLAEYRPPILVGYSSGATLIYAALAQAPVETFAGGISLGFCPDIAIRKPLCKGRGLASVKRTRPPAGYDLEVFPALTVPWVAFQGNVDQVCDPPGTRAFVEKIPSARLVWLPEVGHGFSVTSRWEAQFVDAYRRLAAPPASPPPPSIAAVADLPLTEVPGRAVPGEGLMAVILTGDGGWAEIDKGIAEGLAARGVPMVGWSSLRYYWRPRTPEEASADLARVLRHYLAGWNRERAILIGYSFGADIAPFLVSRLPPTSSRAWPRSRSWGCPSTRRSSSTSRGGSAWEGRGTWRRVPRSSGFRACLCCASRGWTRRTPPATAFPPARRTW
jgi:type IV secretory pathway VirJ component